MDLQTPAIEALQAPITDCDQRLKGYRRDRMSVRRGGGSRSV